MKRKSMLSIIVVVSFATAGFMGQENTAQKKAAPYERLTANVVIVDPDGQPIAGAKLSAQGMVLPSQPLSVFSWIDDQPEKAQDLISDEQGKIALTYPKNPIPGDNVAQIHVLVQHPEFVEFSGRIGPDDDPARITLERGFRIATTAINANTGEAIRENLFGITNRHQPVDWKVAANGTLISPVFGKHETVFRLVEVVAGKAVRFSELLGVDPAERSRFLKKDVKLFDAVAIRGKLNAAVPRPVKKGLVWACVSSPTEVDLKSLSTAWHWESFATVEGDGSFVIESFPRDSTLQIFATCEGWINVAATKDEILSRYPAYAGSIKVGHFFFPQLIEFTDGKNENEIAMEAAGRLAVTVVDDKGKSVSGASVSLGTSQLFFHSGYTSGFGVGRSTGMMLKSLREGVTPDHTAPGTIGRYTNDIGDPLTNELGKVVLVDLPPGSNFGLAHHMDYPTEDNQYGRRVDVIIKSGEEESITIDLGKRVPSEKE